MSISHPWADRENRTDDGEEDWLYGVAENKGFNIVWLKYSIIMTSD